MKTKTLTAVALVLAAIPALGWAQSGAPARMGPPQVDFAAADADSSGGISQAEWTTYVTAQMQERRDARLGAMADELIGAGDANADGLLNRDELMSGFTSMREQRLAARGDSDGEGYGRGHRRFGGDGDEDGDRGWRGRGHDDDRGAMRGSRGDRGDRGGRMDPAERAIRAFEHFDQNEDGQISAEELADVQDRIERRMERRAGRYNH